MWKYTHNAYDFSVLFNTPITYPIAWSRSKIYGPSFRVSVPNFHGLTAFFTAGSVAARFFNPQVGGLGTDLTGIGAFRIDHDEKYSTRTITFNISPRRICHGLGSIGGMTAAWSPAARRVSI